MRIATIIVIAILLGVGSTENLTCGVITDVHLNLNYSSNIPREGAYCTEPSTLRTWDIAPYGRRGCDTPLVLLESTFSKMKEILPEPDFIFSGGDICGHGVPIHNGQPFDQQKYDFLKHVIKTFIAQLKKVYGGGTNPPKVIFVIGNDDLLWDYEVPIRGSWLKADYYGFLYDQFIAGFTANKHADTSENKATFLNGGYYYIDLTPTTRALVLNNMYYSNRNKEENDQIAGEDQFNWLEGQLELLKNRKGKAIIVSHIPYGYFLGPHGTEVFFSDKYIPRYKQIMFKYSGEISLVMSGHMHMSDIKVEEESTENIENIENKRNKSISLQSLFHNLVVNRAVTPSTPNNPGFTIINFIDQNGQSMPNDLFEYTFNIENTINTTQPITNFWKYLYDSHNDLQIQNFTTNGIYTFLQSLTNVEKLIKYQLIRLGYPITADKNSSDKVENAWMDISVNEHYNVTHILQYLISLK